MEQVIVVGTGCAGLTAAIYTARAGLSPLVIEGGQPGGQLTTTSEIENFPGFPEGIDGYLLTDNARKQAERFGARFVSDIIEKTDFSSASSVKQLSSASRSYEGKSVIIATGSSPRLLGIPGEKEMFGGKGVATCATCDGAFYRGMDVAVSGGGDTACEEALFLTRFCTKIYLVHRRNELRASKVMAQRVLSHPKITPVWDTVIQEILPDDSGKVRGIKLRNTKTNVMSELACKGVFVAIGHMPNTRPFENSVELDEQGYIVAAAPGMVRTNVPGVFVAGDCADHIYRQAITAAGAGCRAAIECERWLADQD